MTDRILEVVNELKTRYEKRLELRDKILNVQNEQSQLKIAWLIEANDATDDNGKLRFRNAEMREGYVKAKLHAHESFETRRGLEKEMAELEVEIKILELEFKAQHAMLISKSGNTINLGGK